VTVGFFSPLPPARTGVADYSAALLPALAALCGVQMNAVGADVCLYHLGNNPLHAAIYRQALARPGVAVLHDAVLHHLHLGMLGRQAYIEEFVHNYGEFRREQGAQLWDARGRSAHDPAYFEHALVRRIAEVSLAVVVHNPAAARIVRQHAPGAQVTEIPHLFAPPALPPPEEALGWRASHGIAAGTFLFGVFGYLRESKRLHTVLRAFERLRATGAGAALLVAGDFLSPELERALGPLLAAPNVLRVPFAAERDFWKLASAVDACINLRHPSAGETSGISIRLMGIGKPVLLSAGEETACIPPDAALRVDRGLAEEAALVEYMVWLRAHPGMARQIGARAAAHIAAHHSLQAAARSYAELLSSCCR
jgi:glycosyltransferase involved in cell wall biosynthesis